MNSELETLVSMETSTVTNDEASHEINSLLRAGIDAAKNGKRDEAKALLFRVTDLEPESEMAWLWLASVSEYPEELLTFLQKVLSINPGNEQALEWESSTKALLARNLVQYGITAVQENKKESAKRCFNRALETDANNEMAWLWLASIADDADEKVASLEKVLSINPENEVANTLLKLMRKDEAQELLHQSKKFAVKGNRQEALEMLEQVKQLDANLDEVWVLQAHLSDSFEEKAFCFNQALACNPDNDAAQAGLKSIEPLLHILNNPTQALSPELLHQIESDAGTEMEAVNEDILVENSEEAMESSFSEEGVSVDNENRAFSEVAEQNFVDEPSDESIDTGELYFEERSEDEEAKVDARWLTDVEDEATEQVNKAISEETIEGTVAEDDFVAESTESMASADDVHTTEDSLIQDTEAPARIENLFAENSFASLFQQENGHESNGHENNGHVSEAASDDQFAETLFDEEVSAENFDPSSLIDDVDSDGEADFHFQAMSDLSQSDNGFHHESFVQHEGTAYTEPAVEPEQKSYNESGEDFDAERSYAPGQLYAPVEETVEEAAVEKNHFEESAPQHEITAQTFYFGSNGNADMNEAHEVNANFGAENVEAEEHEAPAVETSFANDEVAEENAPVEMAHEAMTEEVVEEASAMEMVIEEEASAEFHAEETEAAEVTEEAPKPFAQGVACPFCDVENNINDEVCTGCHAVLGLHNVDMLLSSKNADATKLAAAIAEMEAELESKDSVSAEEYFNLGLACLNVKNLESGLKYLQKSYILNPTNSFLKAQIDELTKRMGKMNTMEDVAVETAIAGKTIMVVDDSATIRKLVSAKLEKHGHNVVMAVDGMDALAKLEEMVPDLILLDITMPRLDGYQVCKLIRANDNTRFVPVVLISGKDGFFDKVRGKMCGSTSYITKPFGPEMLLRTVEGYFN